MEQLGEILGENLLRRELSRYLPDRRRMERAALLFSWELVPESWIKRWGASWAGFEGVGLKKEREENRESWEENRENQYERILFLILFLVGFWTGGIGE